MLVETEYQPKRRTKEEKVDQTLFPNAFLGKGKEQNEQVLSEWT